MTTPNAPPLYTLAQIAAVPPAAPPALVWNESRGCYELDFDADRATAEQPLTTKPSWTCRLGSALLTVSFYGALIMTVPVIVLAIRRVLPQDEAKIQTDVNGTDGLVP